MLNLSYFIMNLVDFWNLTLMYSFLFLPRVPTFLRNFMEELVNIFFINTSLSNEIKKILKNDEENSFLDFMLLSSIEKID